MDYENTQIKKDNEDNRLFNNFIELIKRAKEKKEKDNSKNAVIFVTKDYLLKISELIYKIKWRNLLEAKCDKIGINSIHVKDLNLYTDFFVEYDLQTKAIRINPKVNLYKNDEHSANNIKEENNMLKILEIYKEKKTREIEHKYDEQLLELECNDPVNTLVKETEEKLKEMLNSDNVLLVLNSDTIEFTQETIEKRKKIIDIIHQEKKELNDVIKEIESLLELAPNYEEKLQILRDYDIMDKKKNIIL